MRLSVRSAQLRPVKIDLAPQSRASCGQRVDSGRRTALQVFESAHALVHLVFLCVYGPHTAWWRKDRTITLGRRLGRGLLGASSTRSIHTRISTRTSSKHVNPAVSWRPGRNLDPAKTPPHHAPPDRSGRARDLPKASYRARGLRLCLIIILRSSSALWALRRRPALTICWIHGDSSQRRAWPGSRTSGLCGRQNGTRCDGSPEDQLAKDMCSLIWGSMSAAGRR